ncbi:MULTISPECIES: DUF7660 family protein [unclassified Burkholderia]|uniref:DUF7660 family protein n=1 Tax=unclassified Burkholderia TaxID=2613784 RepID=UPI00075EFB49|nr:MULTISPECIES: hypothetical protein [unclassified Burkholderia]KVL19568.1 hypothetical protein WS95_13980 [Burkholderia sp. MSMB1826]KVL37329.1 hypothetical protein WS96_10590 [Burkholderia sp. MSMB1835]
MNDDELKNQMAAKLQHALERVVDERSLVHFLRVLGHDWRTERQLEADAPLSPYAHAALGWENRSIGEYLEAMIDWAEASEEGLGCYDMPDNPWRRIADILFAGKTHE